MGLYERDYTQSGFGSGYGGGGLRMGWPSLTPVVMRLLVANVAVFLIDLLSRRMLGTQGDWLERWAAVYPLGIGRAVQVWRLVTYQFLHAGIGHILMNMLGLYFLGPTLERAWGPRRFLLFYLGCGVAGGLCYTILAPTGWLGPIRPLVGASGAVLGLLAACAILFPQFVVFIIVFPVPIRVAAVMIVFIALAAILSGGGNAGGEAAHFGGLLAGAGYVVSARRWHDAFDRLGRTLAERRRVSERQLGAEVDRILEKVHREGLQSLSHREKGILRRASELERKQSRGKR